MKFLYKFHVFIFLIGILKNFVINAAEGNYEIKDVQPSNWITNTNESHLRFGKIELMDDVILDSTNENVTNYPNILSRQQANTKQQGITMINLGLQSKLQGSPGTTVLIYFEVTNLRNEPAYYNFQVVDEQRYLRNMVPQNAVINPGQIVNVIVTAVIPQNAEVGTRDKITFYSQGLSLESQAAWLTVTAINGQQDNSQPWIGYTYGTRCEGKSSAGNCAGYIWALEIEGRDQESGLLRIQSLPTGLFYRTAFTAGTRDSVSATYTASCCQPKVTIIAYDISGNQKSISLDVTDIYLNEAGIAAIVLGCILIIILIVAIIFCIRWCVKKRESRELPVYRSDRGP